MVFGLCYLAGCGLAPLFSSQTENFCSQAQGSHVKLDKILNNSQKLQNHRPTHLNFFFC
jgi:hypothetical protein